MTPPPPIDRDPRVSGTLPGAFYRDAVAHAALLEGAFARGWQHVGHRGELDPGEARPLTLLEGSLDEPLALVRDEAGALACLSNACTHRGHLVVQERGRCRRLRCRYHGRTFELDGRFKHAPAFEAARDFPRPQEHLARTPLASVCGALFTALAPELDFEAWLAPLAPLLETLPEDEFEVDERGASTYELDANWALYVENYLEGLHIPHVHPALSATLDDAAYRDELFPRGTLQVGVARPDEPAFEPAQQVGRPGERVAAYYAWLWPNVMLNLYPWGMSLNSVEPLVPERTRVRFVPYVWRPELRAQGAGGDLDTVQREDEEVVESCQRGLRSRLYPGGRFSPTREPGSHHFHRMLAACVAGRPAPELPSPLPS